MDTYLSICITILILSQVIRLIQNAIQLHRQNKLFNAQLGHLSEITEADLETQRAFYQVGLEYYNTMLIKDVEK